MQNTSDAGKKIEEIKSTVEEHSVKLGNMEEVVLPGLVERILRLENRGVEREPEGEGEKLLAEGDDAGRKLVDIGKSGEENSGSGSGDNEGGDNEGGDNGGGKKMEEEPAPTVQETKELLKAARRGSSLLGKRDARYHGRWFCEDLAKHDKFYLGPWLLFLIRDRGLEKAEIAAREEIQMAGDRVLQGLSNATPQERANARASSIVPRELLARELENRREGGSLLLYEFLLVDICSWDRAVKEETYKRYVGVAGQEAGNAAMAEVERSLMCTGTRQVSGEQFVYEGKAELRAIGERLWGVGRAADLRGVGESCSKLAYGMARRLKLERGAGDTSGNWTLTGERMALVITLGAVGAAVAENRSRAAYLRDCADFFRLPITPDASLALMCGAGGHKWWGGADSSLWWGATVAR